MNTKNICTRVSKLEQAIPDPTVTDEQKARLLKFINRGLRIAYGEAGEEYQELTMDDLEHLDEHLAAAYAQAEAEHPGEDPDELRAAAIKRTYEETRESYKRNQAAAQAEKAS